LIGKKPTSTDIISEVDIFGQRERFVLPSCESASVLCLSGLLAFYSVRSQKRSPIRAGYGPEADCSHWSCLWQRHFMTDMRLGILVDLG